MNRLKWVVLSFLILLPSFAFAQAKVGTSGVQFLKVGVGARAVGMGEAFTAVANDASALYYNPGGLVQLRKPEAVFSLIDYPAGIKFVYVGGIIPTPQTSGVAGVQVTSLYTDDMIETTPGMPYGTGRTFNSSDLSIGLSYSQKLTDKFSVGTTVKFINERLADASATGWGADVGTFYSTGWERINIGMVIQNFGPDMEFESSPFPIPMSFKFGASIGAIDNELYRLTLAGEFIHPNDNVEQYNLGAEFTAMNMFSLRIGKHINGLIRDSWHDYQEDPQNNPFLEYPILETDEDGNVVPSLDGLSLGLGLLIPQAGVNVDYAWAGLGTLGSVHRFTIGYKLTNLIR